MSRRAASRGWGLTACAFGVVGMAVSLVLMVAVSLMTAEPDEETKRMVDKIRIPRGKAVLAATH